MADGAGFEDAASCRQARDAGPRRRASRISSGEFSLARRWPFPLMRRDAGYSPRPASTPSIEGPSMSGAPNRSHPAFIPVPGAGTLLQIAIGWMMCQDGHPPPLPPSCLSEKTAIRSPRRQRPFYQGSHASCCSPPVRLRPSRSQPSGATSHTSYPRKRCAATADRGPDGCRRKRAVLGRWGCSRRGDGIAVFQRGRCWHGGAEIRRAQIHLIAIRRSRPWPEGRCI